MVLYITALHIYIHLDNQMHSLDVVTKLLLLVSHMLTSEE